MNAIKYLISGIISVLAHFDERVLLNEIRRVLHRQVLDEGRGDLLVEPFELVGGASRAADFADETAVLAAHLVQEPKQNGSPSILE